VEPEAQRNRSGQKAEKAVEKKKQNRIQTKRDCKLWALRSPSVESVDSGAELKSGLMDRIAGAELNGNGNGNGVRSSFDDMVM